MSQTVRIPVDDVELDGDLNVPAGAGGIVLFAHGSGSGRHSPRNRHVAEVLVRAGLGTVLVDLLTPEEERTDLATRELRFDIPLLAGRLVGIVDWLAAERPIGLFGASTGAAAALIAATERPSSVRAVVSRGGRPDLAHESLSRVEAPTQLIVGGRDDVVLRLNREAQGRMTALTSLEVVPGATHLFEERGALEQVADLAADWFRRHLRTAANAPPES